MKKELLIIMVPWIFLSLSWQSHASIPGEISNDSFSYPRIKDSAQDYLQSNLQYPELARENGIEGEVKLLLSLDQKGEVKGVQILSGPGYGCNMEASRLVSNMPAWYPAILNGVAIPYNVKFTIRFRLW